MSSLRQNKYIGPVKWQSFDGFGWLLGVGMNDYTPKP